MGHTDSDYKTTCSAIEAGAGGVTHTFNGMRPLHHRDPGILGAALMDERVVCECICDDRGYDNTTSNAEYWGYTCNYTNKRRF